MPRASRSRVQVEIETEPGIWTLYKGGFGKVSSAEDWIRENILDGFRLRAVRVAGVFKKQVTVTKR